MFVSRRRDLRAARAFFRAVLAAHGEPDEVIADLARSLEAVVEELIPDGFHDTPDLASDPRFADLQGRVMYGDEINEHLAQETANSTTAALVKLMDEADVPAAPVNTREEMIADPHVQHRGIVEESVHPTAGRIRSLRSPGLFSKTASVHTRHAPLFGQHTDKILTQLLAVSADELTSLRTDGVIA